jgi:hypothetical protein
MKRALGSCLVSLILLSLFVVISPHDGSNEPEQMFDSARTIKDYLGKRYGLEVVRV